MKATKLMDALKSRYNASPSKSGQISGLRSESGCLFFRRDCNNIQVFGEPGNPEFEDIRDYLHNVVDGIQVLDDDSGFIEVWAE